MNYAMYTHTWGMHMMQTLPPAVVAILWPLLGIVLVWSLIWKGFAFWHSARNHQLIWFIVFLFINTAGILEILYLIFWRKNKNDVVTTTTTTHVTTATTPAAESGTPSVQ